MSREQEGAGALCFCYTPCIVVFKMLTAVKFKPDTSVYLREAKHTSRTLSN